MSTSAKRTAKTFTFDWVVLINFRRRRARCAYAYRHDDGGEQRPTKQKQPRALVSSRRGGDAAAKRRETTRHSHHGVPQALRSRLLRVVEQIIAHVELADQHRAVDGEQEAIEEAERADNDRGFTKQTDIPRD